MATPCEATDTRRIGVFVLAEFKLLEDSKFIKAICPPARHPNVIEVRFARPYPISPMLPPIESLPFKTTICGKLPRRKYEVHLYSLPPSAPKGFLLSDLEFPVAIAGFVLIVNLHSAVSARLNWPETMARLRRDIPFEEAIRKGKIRWIREQQLPFVIAATDPTPLAISLDELRDLFDLDPQVPVISLPARFRRKDVERVLLALVEQIEATSPNVK